MKQVLLAACLMAALACNQKGIKYAVYANGNLAFEILPQDIEFYDTTQYRGYTEIHEIRLRSGFYKKDSILLPYPIKMVCTIDGKKYFWGEHYFRAQEEPYLDVNFHFDPDCENSWKFSEGGPAKPREGDTVVLYTNNPCNSIELFHKKKEIVHYRQSYYDKEEYFRNYIDTARLAHEILLDPYYLKAIKDSGIIIK